MLTLCRRIESKIRYDINSVLDDPDPKHMRKRRALPTFLLLAIRLRQAVAHPFLLYTMMRDMFELEDIQIIRKEIAEVKKANPDRLFKDQVGIWWEEQINHDYIGKVTRPELRVPFGKGDHGLVFDMDPQLAEMEKLKTLGGDICNVCFEPFTAPRKTKCKHVFCKQCITNLIDTERHLGNTTVNCPMCNARYRFDAFICASESEEGAQSARRRQSAKRNRAWDPRAAELATPGADYRGFEPVGREDSGRFLDECDRNPYLAVAPSAKSAMVKDIILKWQKDFPNDKIIG